MDRGSDDLADAKCRSTDDDREGNVFFFDELLPQIVWCEFVHDDEAGDEDDDTQEGIDQRVEEDDEVHKEDDVGWLILDLGGF
jgi:hypothetical protein